MADGGGGSFGYSESGFSSTPYSLLWPFSYSKPWRALCLFFQARRPFPSLVECIPWNILLQGHMTQSWKPLFSEPYFLCFHFLLKHKPNQLFLFLVWGCGRVTQQGPSSKQVRRGLWKLALGCLPWEEGCWDGILVPWKGWHQAVMRKQPCWFWCLFVLLAFALTPGWPKPGCHGACISWAIDLQHLVAVNLEQV